MIFECLDRDLRDLHVMRNLFRNRRYASRELFSPPLEMPDAQFYQNYRMTKASFLTLNALLAPLISGRDVDPALPHSQPPFRRATYKYQKVLLALKYYGSNDLHRITGDTMGYSAKTACYAVCEVSKAICSLFPEFIQMPTVDEKRQVSDGVLSHLFALLMLSFSFMERQWKHFRMLQEYLESGH